MKKAVMYGAGNIGRGFIAQKLSVSGYEVVFVDIDQALIERMNELKRYPLTIVAQTPEEIYVENIRAVCGKDEQAVIDEIATADILATSVGANILKFIAPLVAQGLSARWKNNPDSKLDILLCENLNHADKIFFELLNNNLSEDDQARLKTQIGLVETSIGRMVPIMTKEMQAGEPLRVCVERYDFLPIDKDAFTGDVLTGPNIVPYSPFSFYLQRKLFLHNMGHALTAYLGEICDAKFIYEAIAMPHIRFFVQSAMQQSALALSSEYGVSVIELFNHVDDLLYRFSNKALMDSVERVGRDPLRKIAAHDRFSGSIEFCLSNDIYPIYAALGMAAALFRLKKEKEKESEAFNAQSLLEQTAKIDPSSSIGKDILTLFSKLESGSDFFAIQEFIEQRKSELRGAVV